VSSRKVFGSQDERATTACCLELQESGNIPIMMRKPETDFQLSPIPQSESVRALKSGCHVSEPPRVTP